MICKKQMSDNNQWVAAMAKIETIVSREELKELVDCTVADIKRLTNGKKSAYAWSGGKDSIVLSKLCEMSGITDSMIGVCNLEYPAFMDWVNNNKPEECEIINTGQDLEWLSKHPEMLFPNSSSKSARWFSIVQHRAQREYFKNHELDVLLLGRRRADGNYVGKKSNIYTDGRGITRYSPLSDWGHEYILAFIHYNNLPLPPIYGWKNGYICGTHPWPARPYTGGKQNGWREIYDIDKNIVIAAAELLPGARKCLEEVTKR